MTSRRLSLWLFFSIILTLSACNLPRNQASTETSPNAVFTAAAQTVEAQLTQNALLAPATPVPPSPLPAATIAQTALPSETPLPLPQDTPAGTLVTPICDARCGISRERC